MKAIDPRRHQPRSDGWTDAQEELIRSVIRQRRPLTGVVLERLAQLGPRRTLGAAKTRRHRLAEEMRVPVRPVRGTPQPQRLGRRRQEPAKPAIRLARQGKGYRYEMAIPGGPVTGWRPGTEAEVRQALEQELRAYLDRAEMVPGTAYCPQYSRRGGDG